MVLCSTNDTCCNLTSIRELNYGMGRLLLELWSTRLSLLQVDTTSLVLCRELIRRVTAVSDVMAVD